MVGLRRRRADGRDRHVWPAAADSVLLGSSLVDHVRMACVNPSGPCELREATNFGQRVEDVGPLTGLLRPPVRTRAGRREGADRSSSPSSRRWGHSRLARDVL